MLKQKFSLGERALFPIFWKKIEKNLGINSTQFLPKKGESVQLLSVKQHFQQHFQQHFEGVAQHFKQHFE